MDDDEICCVFIANPKIHPETGKRLIYGKGPYLKYVKLCKDKGYDVEESVKSVKSNKLIKSVKSVKTNKPKKMELKVDDIVEFGDHFYHFEALVVKVKKNVVDILPRENLDDRVNAYTLLIGMPKKYLRLIGHRNIHVTDPDMPNEVTYDWY